jgi:hypothetical protein
VDRLLKPDGIFVMEAITTPESRYEEYLRVGGCGCVGYRGAGGADTVVWWGRGAADDGLYQHHNLPRQLLPLAHCPPAGYGQPQVSSRRAPRG